LDLSTFAEVAGGHHLRVIRKFSTRKNAFGKGKMLAGTEQEMRLVMEKDSERFRRQWNALKDQEAKEALNQKLPESDWLRSYENASGN
jgi:hypothetical protein